MAVIGTGASAIQFTPEVQKLLDEHGHNVAAWPGTLPELRKRLSRFDLMNYRVRVRRPSSTGRSDRDTSAGGEHEGLEVA